MNEPWEAQQSYEPKPRAHNIAIALVVAAATFSYLGCVAIVGALQKYDIIAQFPKDHDPKWRWFLMSFAGLTALFLGVAAICRHFSRRHHEDDPATRADEEVRVKPASPAKEQPAASDTASQTPAN